ncbi:MBL fold metallo-hydrolase [Maritimibacter sp. UBA3975]|uniref:MBL fold metallo-hydrolase n=1 Tax=Maritimibacter sp. UBA3975 TaxID=1946833 RepID=UPI000C0981DF|nr:MBL fold metallo-hydrolase [Maritimibacter sp. UBA3975]MAM62000.1 MBL fold metallo-hydrolase [Maritimibacter sp.]|tara:strand:- start:6503 stop:7327 length:825 start_codon:yes stop_codon:yes gene_type:complete
MIPVFANSATVRTRESFVLRGGRRAPVALQVRFGLLEHPTVGPVLIDTGYTHETVAGPRSAALRTYARILRPRLHDAGQPAAVLARRGIGPEDVAAVILTHFHADHVSGLRQFPNARVFACDRTFARIAARGTLGNLRHGIFPELLPDDIATRLTGFSTLPRAQADVPKALTAVADLFGDGHVLTVDLPGHAEGHVGLLFPRLDTPLLYACDTQWMLSALDPGRAPGWPARLIADDPDAGMATTRAVAAFRAAGGQVMLCHDPDPAPYDMEPAP